MYDCPIVDIKFHTGFGGERRVVSADTKIVKIWDQATGKGFTSVEPEADINDVCLWPGSGAPPPRIAAAARPCGVRCVCLQRQPQRPLCCVVSAQAS